MRNLQRYLTELSNRSGLHRVLIALLFTAFAVLMSFVSLWVGLPKDNPMAVAVMVLVVSFVASFAWAWFTLGTEEN